MGYRVRGESISGASYYDGVKPFSKTPLCACCKWRVEDGEEGVVFDCKCRETSRRCFFCGKCWEHGKCETCWVIE